MMRKVMISLILIAAAVGCAERLQPPPAPAYGRAVNGLSCGVESSKRQYETDEPIVLKCIVSNETDKDVHFIRWLDPYYEPVDAWSNALPDVVDERGAKLTFLRPGRRFVVAPRIPLEAERIPAKGTWHTEIQILPRCRVPELGRWPVPGGYKVRVRFEAYSLERWRAAPYKFGFDVLEKMKVSFWTGQLVSSTIKIEVVSAGGKKAKRGRAKKLTEH